MHVEFMEALIQKKWIHFGKNGPRLSKAALARMSPSEVSLAKQLLPGVEKSARGVRFDNRFASVVHPRISQSFTGRLRGRIVDRHGVLLAGWDQESRKRSYPSGPATFHVIGYGGDLYGKTGLEAVYDSVLNAESAPWWRLFWRGDNPFGGDVRITIDSEIQKAAYDAMADRPGAVVVMAPKTGDILALVSTPSFDPNYPPGWRWIQAEESTHRPFLNRALSERYPPGSIFKLLVAGAGLDSGQAPVMDLPRFDRRLRISDRRAFGRIDFNKALAVSSNVYFSRWG